MINYLSKHTKHPLYRKFLMLKFDPVARLEFYEIIYSYISSDLAPIDYLKRLGKRYEERGDFRRPMVEEWLDTLGEGGKFGDALKEWISESEYNLLQMSDKTEGSNRIAIEKCIYLMEQNSKILQGFQGLIKTISMYLGLSLAFLMGFVGFALPIVSERVDVELMERSRFIGQVTFFSNYWFLILVVAVLLMVFITKSLSWHPGALRQNVLDKIPPYGLVKLYRSSTFLISFSAFISNGMDIDEAFLRLKETKNKWLYYYVDDMAEKHISGKFSTSQVLTLNNFFDLDIKDKISDYAGTGAFESKIERVGETLVTDILKKLGKLNVQFSFWGKIAFLLTSSWLVFGTGQLLKQSLNVIT